MFLLFLATIYYYGFLQCLTDCGDEPWLLQIVCDSRGACLNYIIMIVSLFLFHSLYLKKSHGFKFKFLCFKNYINLYLMIYL